MESLIDIQSINSVLIIQIRPYGDVLLNTAYLPVLRRTLPRARIDFLVRRPYDTVLLNDPHIDNLVVFDKKKGAANIIEKLRLLRRVRNAHYDVIIDQIQGTTSAQVICFSGAKYKIAYANARWNLLYNLKVPRRTQRYSASMKFDLLRPLGIEEEPYSLYFTVDAASEAYIDQWLRVNTLAGKAWVCLSPGSPRQWKKWKAEHFARLGDLIFEQTGLPVVISGAPGEKKDVQQVAGHMRHEPVLAPPTTYRQAAALLKRSRLLICNDGGLNHLAVAVNTPSLAIFGNTDPTNWAPELFSGHHYLFSQAFDSSRDNSFGISPETAFAKVLEILKE